MTREETAEAIKVMEAYRDGKKIEICEKENNVWVEILLQPCWDWYHNRYRIASNQEQTDQEPKEKHYRPYTMEEFVENMHKHDEFVRNKNSESYGSKIICVNLNSVICCDGFTNRHVNYSTDYNWLCSYFVWSNDGTPCGKEVMK